MHGTMLHACAVAGALAAAGCGMALQNASAAPAAAPRAAAKTGDGRPVVSPIEETPSASRAVNEAAESAATTEQPAPRVAAKPIVAEYAAKAPPVMLTAGHAALCRVSVGDVFPAIELPQIGAGPTKLSAFSGQKATVVLFWQPGHWMSHIALADVAKDVAAAARDAAVGVVGIVEAESSDAAKADLGKAQAKFSQLLDADGAALAKVGSVALPRVYVLDGEGRIAWFDIEFSEATRRELQQILGALTGAK
jgi:peroxiredoxin